MSVAFGRWARALSSWRPMPDCRRAAACGFIAALLALSCIAAQARDRGARDDQARPSAPSGQAQSGAQQDAREPSGAAEAVDKEAAEPEPAASRTQQRTKINLLGQADTRSGESRRNENIQFNLIDNNVLRELNARLG